MILTRSDGKTFEIMPSESIELIGEPWAERSPPLLKFLFECDVFEHDTRMAELKERLNGDDDNPDSE